MQNYLYEGGTTEGCRATAKTVIWRRFIRSNGLCRRPTTSKTNRPADTRP